MEIHVKKGIKIVDDQLQRGSIHCIFFSCCVIITISEVGENAYSKSEMK